MMVGAIGLEPTTPTMSRWCSNQLSYAPPRNPTLYEDRRRINVPAPCRRARLALPSEQKYAFGRGQARILSARSGIRGATQAHQPNEKINSMTHLWSPSRGRILGVAIAVTMLAMSRAEAAQPLPDESQLVAAGFKVVAATTKEQQEHLQTLPPGKLTAWQRNGKHFWIYPDVARKQLYVGTQKEYEAYRQLVPGGGPTLSQQQAADLASYNRQDAAMKMYNNRDLADPYYFWDNFDGLGWR